MDFVVLNFIGFSFVKKLIILVLQCLIYIVETTKQTGQTIKTNSVIKLEKEVNMTKEKQKILFEKYPSLFRDKNKPPNETCMCWGCSCGDGWFDILDKLCEDIDKINTNPEFRFLQVKEKFGGLRVSVIGGSNNIFDLIYKAECVSLKICEKCGTKDNVEQRGDCWIYTLCNNCHHDMEADPAWMI